MVVSQSKGVHIGLREPGEGMGKESVGMVKTRTRLGNKGQRPQTQPLFPSML